MKILKISILVIAILISLLYNRFVVAISEIEAKVETVIVEFPQGCTTIEKSESAFTVIKPEILVDYPGQILFGALVTCESGTSTEIYKDLDYKEGKIKWVWGNGEQLYPVDVSPNPHISFPP